MINKKLRRMWYNMNQRCYNENSSGFKYYGGSGVTVCKEWRDSFLSFKTWAINNGYMDGLSIDKDVLCNKLKIYPKIYSPNTCLFVDIKFNNGYTNGDELKSNTVFQIRISDEDLAEIKQAATIKGVKTAQFIKETMKDKAKRLIAKAS